MAIISQIFPQLFGGDPLARPTNGLIQLNQPTFQPWKVATFGDSRSNTGSSAPDVGSFQSKTDLRMPMWFEAHMQDAEITRNYGLSGDVASAWADDARTGGKTFLDLCTSDVEVVLMQYGVNDCLNLVASGTTIANLKACISEFIKAGKYVIFESINPVHSAASNYVAGQVAIDVVNAALQTWLATFDNKAIYVDTATTLKGRGAYADTYYYNADGVHFIRPGAYIAGKIIAAAARTLLNRRQGFFVGPDTISPNLLNLMSPSMFSGVETGGSGTVSTSSGQDVDGHYLQWSFTPSSLTSSQCRVRLEANVNFQNTVDPFFTLSGNEILQGSSRIKVDNGTDGGIPAVYGVFARQRFYTGSVFRDWGIIGNAPDSTTPDYTESIDWRFITPRVTNATASSSAAPSVGAGYSLQVFIQTQSTGNPIRVRLYNPQLRRAAYSSTPASVTPPASTVAYTNSTQGNQEIWLSAGTVTVIAVNGVTTGMTSGMFVLNPADTLTITYAVAPTMIVKQI